MHKAIIVVIFFVFIQSGFCQYDLPGKDSNKSNNKYSEKGPVSSIKHYKSFGCDANPLLRTLLPFNSLSRQSPLVFVFRQYWNNNGIRTGFGFNSDINKPYIALETGYDSRRRIENSRWYYFKGLEFGLMFFDNKSSPRSGVSATWTNGGYLTMHMGIEYTIDKYLSFSTEARLGANTNVGLHTVPPTNFIFHLRL